MKEIELLSSTVTVCHCFQSNQERNVVTLGQQISHFGKSTNLPL